MGRLFGTDGIRGIANRDLSIRRAEEVGMALAEVIRGEHPEKRPTVVIGRDTRLSGEMLQAALAGGLMAGGADVVLLGVVPTPAVAYLTVQKKAAAGVVISASHNPYEFNGIKIFGPEGYKLTDDEEDEIERMLLDRDIPMIPVEPEEIGTCREDREAAVQYAGYLASTVPEKLTGMKVLVDCSNGAAVRTAEELFSLLGAEATILCDAPDGTNINRECGSTHVEHLASLMAEGKYDLAVAFDGDADRCLAVDEKGHVVNGDQMIAIFARQMKAEGRLPGDAAVVTVMSSFGFFRFAKENGIHAETTKVGDRYVLENMRKNGYNIGGEQSGHIIFREYMPTGDGEPFGHPADAGDEADRRAAECAGRQNAGNAAGAAECGGGPRHEGGPARKPRDGSAHGGVRGTAGRYRQDPYPGQRHRAADPRDGGGRGRCPDPGAWPSGWRPGARSC